MIATKSKCAGRSGGSSGRCGREYVTRSTPCCDVALQHMQHTRLSIVCSVTDEVDGSIHWLCVVPPCRRAARM